MFYARVLSIAAYISEATHIIGKVLCQGGPLEVDEGIREYGQPLVIIELGIKFCLSMILSRKDPQGVLC